MATSKENHLSAFLNSKTAYTHALFNHFISSFNSVGTIDLIVLKTMIGVDNNHKHIAYITQLGKNFIHVVFPFKQEYTDNLCFQKIAKVPGQQQFNHHFRMLHLNDVNEEVMGFMRLAYREEA